MWYTVKKILKVLAVLITVAIIVAVVLAGYLLVNVDSFGKNSHQNVIKSVMIKIPKGSSTSKVAEILKSNKIIDNTLIFQLISKIKGYDGKYLKGTYNIDWNKSYYEVMYILTHPQALTKFMIPEYMNIYQLQDRLINADFLNAKSFIDKSNKVKCNFRFAKGIPSDRKPRYEGYLFPATYNFPKYYTMEEITKILLETFNKRYTPFMYAKAKKIGLSTDEVVTLASIVERETGNPIEYRKIAGVFMNRLKVKMKLQSDATINYYLDTLKELKRNIILKKISKKELGFTAIHTPYNTYLHSALPPGPICSPSIAAIIAVLNYEKHDFYYFYAKRNAAKTSAFSKTYYDHQQAIKQFQR